MAEGGTAPEISQPEQEPNYTEIRKSLEHLGEVVPGMIVKLTHEGQEEVVVLPHQRVYPGMMPALIPNWTVAVSDRGIRVLNMVPSEGVCSLFEEAARRGGSEEEVMKMIEYSGCEAWSSVPENPVKARGIAKVFLASRVDALREKVLTPLIWEPGSREKFQGKFYQSNLFWWNKSCASIFSASDTMEPVAQAIHKAADRIAGLGKAPPSTHSNIPPA